MAYFFGGHPVCIRYVYNMVKSWIMCPEATPGRVVTHQIAAEAVMTLKSLKQQGVTLGTIKAVTIGAMTIHAMLSWNDWLQHFSVFSS